MRGLNCMPTIIYQDKMYLVYRKIKQRRIKEGKANDLKTIWFCDIIIKDKTQEDSTLLFLREISDAIIVED